MKYIIALGFIVFSAFSFGQDIDENFNQKEIKPKNTSISEHNSSYDVNFYTGSPKITIPLFEFGSNNLSIPIGLTYLPNGIKINEEASFVGMSWILNTGGRINAQIAGISDYAFTGCLRRSPKYPVKAHVMSGGEISLTNGSTLSNGSAVDFIDNYFFHNNNVDLEPDIYSFNFINKSGSFFFAPGEGIPILKTTDNLIYDSEPSYSQYPIHNTWKFFDTFGNSYYFGGLQSVDNKPKSVSYCQIQRVTGYWENEFPDSWSLTKIESPLNERIEFEYDKYCHLVSNSNTMISDPIDEYPLASYFPYSYSSTIENVTTGVRRIEIVYPVKIRYYINDQLNKEIQFEYSTGRNDVPIEEYSEAVKLENVILYSVIDNVYTPIKGYHLIYDNLVNRLWLTGLEEIGYINGISSSERPKHEFTYINKNGVPSINGTYTGDYWGYFNGDVSNKGPKRCFTSYGYFKNYTGSNVKSYAPNTETILFGTLNKIMYPTGGYSVFSFGPHYFSNTQGFNDEELEWQNTMNTSSFSSFGYGAGLRINKIDKFDNNDQLIVSKIYEYTFDNGETTGILFQMPVNLYYAWKRIGKNYTTIGNPSLKYTGYEIRLKNSQLVSGNCIDNIVVGYSEVKEYISSMEDNGYTKYKFFNEKIAPSRESVYIPSKYDITIPYYGMQGVPSSSYNNVFNYNTLNPYETPGIPFNKENYISGCGKLNELSYYNKNNKILKKLTYEYETIIETNKESYGLRWTIPSFDYINGVIQPESGGCLDDHFADHIVQFIYKIKSNSFIQKKINENDYFYDEMGGSRNLLKSTSFDYTLIKDNTYNQFNTACLLKKTDFQNSDTRTIVNYTVYPSMLLSDPNAEIQAMASNMISNKMFELPIFSHSITCYPPVYGNSLFTKYIELGSGKYAPGFVFTLKNIGMTQVGVHPALSEYKLDKKFGYTNSRLSYLEENEIERKSYKWNNTWENPIVEAHNVRPDEISFSSFETSDNDGWLNINERKIKVLPDDTHCGQYCVKVNPVSYGPSLSIEINSNNLDSYYASVWVKGSPLAYLIIQVNEEWNSVIQANIPIGTDINKWQLLKVILPKEIITQYMGTTSQPYIKVYCGNGSLTNNAFFDDIRFMPCKGLMTTNTFYPSGKLSSITDINDKTMYYEYDCFGRLRIIRDSKLNIINLIEYQLVNQ